MTEPRTASLRWLLAPIAALCLILGTSAPAAAQGLGGGDDNEATAINTEDGSTVFDFALTVRRVADGTIDQTNTANAQASCTDCRTVAVAFQIVLVSGDADAVVPENLALAANSECAECFTYAAATQIVLGADDVKLTAAGHRRLAALQQRMREIEDTADEMSDAELLAAVQEAEAELVAIFNEELVPRDAPAGDPGSGDPPVTSSTATDGSTTTTAPDGSEEGSGSSSTTSTTEVPSTTSPTTTTAPTPSTTVAA